MIRVYHINMIRIQEASREVIDTLHKLTLDWDANQQELVEQLKPYYEPVADFNTDNLDHAYYWSNSIDCLWTDLVPGRGTLIGKPQQRSSSVGDVFVRNGETFVVAPCGFTRLAVDMEAK